MSKYKVEYELEDDESDSGAMIAIVTLEGRPMLNVYLPFDEQEAARELFRDLESVEPTASGQGLTIVDAESFANDLYDKLESLIGKHIFHKTGVRKELEKIFAKHLRAIANREPEYQNKFKPEGR